MATERFTDTDIRVGEAVARVLEEAGVDMVFGIIGGDSWMLFDALNEHKDTIRAVTVREESLAGVMAEVYGRLTGRPGVVYGQGAWVISNALLGTLEAKLSSSPMLLLADLSDGHPFAHHGYYQTGAGAYGGFDAKTTLDGVTKRTTVVTEGPMAVQTVQLAIKHATSGERGPVAVLFSSRALKSKVGPSTVPTIYPTQRYVEQHKPAAPDAGIAELAQRFAAASKPVIVAGNGVRISQAYDQLADLAARYGAPVATSSNGKGVFNEKHELGLGVSGQFGTPLANATIAAADLVVVLGSKLAPTDTANESPDLMDPTRQDMVQIDIEPQNAAWTYPVDQSLVGDLAATLDRLAELDVDTRPSAEVVAERVAAVESARREFGWFDDESSTDDREPMLPERVVKVLNEALPDDAMITCDAGENRLFMMRYFQCAGRGDYLQSAGVGGMGYAIPAALAAKLVDPSRPAVAVCGDGGFGMSLNGIMTALEQDIPIIVVVMNNNVLGWVYNGLGKRHITAELGEYDFGAVARAMGAEGARVSNSEQFAKAMEEALASNKPYVIDVEVALDKEHTYLKTVSPLMSGNTNKA
ncbi:thiamine pyrophosphate-binding protein [Actinomadura rugatobispora]|uniref:Thiamine pyrophosphate-binding protein n=1 Tax=Actinomadura rugatobispora TaxID=1994 RepID=A0ABW0ZRM2_9ACTN|nr:pyruvate oxidase [Actinomadura rugatobispora]